MKNTLLRCSLLLLTQPALAQTPNPDIELLHSAGLKTDGPSLLEYFRREADPREVARLIKLLGDPSYAAREKAQKELLQLGPSVLTELKWVENHADPEIDARVRNVRQTILARAEPSIQAAAARLIGTTKPNGAAEVLLAYLPLATDANVIDEFSRAISAAAIRDGVAEPVVVKCLNDPLPIKRSVAAQVLLGVKSKQHLPFIRTMLQDPEPQVRLRVGVALIAAKEKEALPVLVDLLGVIDPDQLWQVKAIFMQMTGARTPEIYLGDDVEYNKDCRDIWHGWLSRNMDKVDLARLDNGIDVATIGAYLKIGAEYGAWPRSDPHRYGPSGPLEDLPGFRFKFSKAFPKAKLPDVAVPFGLDLSRAEVTDENLKELTHLKNLTTLGLANNRVTNEGLKELVRLPSLTTLDLTATHVTNAGIKDLALMPNLSTLHLPAWGVSNEGLKDLAPLKDKLTALHLGYHVSGAGLKELAPLTNLTTLDLSQSESITPERLKDLAPLQKLTTLHLHYVNDDGLRALREIGLLHALPQALGKDRTRPKSMAEVVALDLRGTRVTDAGLQELAPLINLATLDLAGLQVTDAGMTDLAPLQNLARLGLSNTKVTDAGLKHLASLENLAHLDLSGSGVTGAGLKDLVSLKNLATLDLRESKVTDAGLKDVAALKSLTTLVLRGRWGSGVTDAGLKNLAPLTNLALLDLHETKVTDAGMKELAPLKNLAALDLSETAVTDAGMKDVAALKGLTTLDLRGTRVTDAGLKKLTPLKNLARIGLSSDQVSDASLRVLREMNLLHSLHSLWESTPLLNSADTVTKLYLGHTKLTDAGLKELASLKDLTYVQLPVVTDATLRELRGIGLLHALDLASGHDGERPRSADEVASFDLRRTKITDAGLKELAGFKNLAELGLSETAVTDAGLKELASFKNLACLDLRYTKVAGAGLKHLAGCKSLTILEYYTTDAGLRALREIDMLHILYSATWPDHPKSAAGVTTYDLRCTQVTDAGLKELAPLKNLADLRLPTITDAALRELRDVGLLHVLDNAGGADLERPKSADQVVSLSLSGTAVTDAGLKHLASLKNLTRLNLSGTKVTDAGLKELASFKDLASLDLSDTRVTEAGLRRLAGCKNLTFLGLNPTDANLRVLREIGLLHAISVAHGPDRERPGSADGVVSLDLTSTKVTDAGLKELTAEFKNLGSIYLRETEVTDAGLKHLADCKSLTCIVLDVTDARLRALREIDMLHALCVAHGDGQRPRSRDDVLYLDLSKSKVTDAALKEIAAEFKNLATLDLRDTGVTDGGLKHLAGCKSLTCVHLNTTDATLRSLRDIGLLHALASAKGKDDERPSTADDVVSLDLHESKVTNEGLKELASLKNLRHLSLPAVTDATLRELRGIGLLHALDHTQGKGRERPRSEDEVVELNLNSMKVTDEGLKELAGFKNLAYLCLVSTDVTDAGLKELARFKNLTTLALHRTGVLDAGLKHLAPLKNLTHLSLPGVTDATLRELRDIGLLHALSCAEGKNYSDRPKSAAEVLFLDLRHSKVTDVGLKELAALKNLATLDLRDTSVTAAGIAELRKMLPKCEIVR